jgi:hypothetical protein
MTHRIRHLVAAALMLALGGCSYQCHFEARGVVREAADGRPIANARVEMLDASGRPLLDNPAVTTDPQGQFQVKFTTGPTSKEELTGWTAELSADGYEPETIAIGPIKEPKRHDVTVYLIFHVSLRKAQ